MDIEEAKIKLIEWVDDDRVLRDNSTDSDFDRFCEEKNVAIETVLTELDKQEKIINAMAEDIYDSDDLFNHIYVDGIEGIKQYYEKKVSEE